MLYAELVIDEHAIKDIALNDIDKIMRENGRSLKDYPPMPIPNSAYAGCQANVMLMEELNYNKCDMQGQYDQLVATITDEQKHIFNTVYEACYNGSGGLFLVNGFGGMGKTFVLKTLATAIRAKGDIVLAGKLYYIHVIYFNVLNYRSQI